MKSISFTKFTLYYSLRWTDQGNPDDSDFFLSFRRNGWPQKIFCFLWTGTTGWSVSLVARRLLIYIHCSHPANEPVLMEVHFESGL